MPDRKLGTYLFIYKWGQISFHFSININNSKDPTFILFAEPTLVKINHSHVVRIHTWALWKEWPYKVHRASSMLQSISHHYNGEGNSNKQNKNAFIFVETAQALSCTCKFWPLLLYSLTSRAITFSFDRGRHPELYQKHMPYHIQSNVLKLYTI